MGICLNFRQSIIFVVSSEFVVTGSICREGRKPGQLSSPTALVNMANVSSWQQWLWQFTHIDIYCANFLPFLSLTDSRRTRAPCCCRHWERSSAGFIKLPFTDYWKNNNNRVITKRLHTLVWLINDLYGVFANLQVLKTDGSLVAVLGVRQKRIPWRFRYEESKLESLMGKLDKMTLLKIQLMIWWMWRS